MSGKDNHKGKFLYIDAPAGISGDMTVAALLDLGADEQVLRDVLATLPEQHFRIAVTRVQKAALDCCDFDVQPDAAYANHDHDMEYLYGHLHEHDHDHEHDHEHHHEHEHDHEHDHKHDHDHGHAHDHHHVHRTLADVERIINSAEMTDGARDTALRIFRILAEAEAKAHGATADTVHFHEVGSIDSIVDIVSAAVCLDNLGVCGAVIPELGEGGGTVRTQHGILPVPVPAVAHIAAAYGLPLHMTGNAGERITPTGAAVCAAIRTQGELPRRFRILGTGYGAGKRDYNPPSILRIMLVEEEADPADMQETAGTENPLQDRTAGQPGNLIWKLETNVDDCTGEMLGYCMERLFAAGARDVHYIPVFMKKNRPAWQLNVICDEEKIPELEQIIFEETTTIGIRRTAMERTLMQRGQVLAATPYGEVQVKICRTERGQGADVVRCYPEYDSVSRIASEKKIPFQTVANAAREAAEQAERE